MALAEILDFSKLIAPIAGDDPAGADLRTDISPLSPYQVIKSARQQARAAERQALMDEPGSSTPKADWRPVLQQSPKAIAELSKDVEIAAWLTEALVRQYGFAGLRDGLRLTREMSERFFDGLHPRPNDEDGMDHRFAALAGLNGVDSEGTLFGPINAIPLTNGNGSGPYTRSDYKQASDLESITDPDRRAQRLGRGAVSLEMIERAAKETSAEFFANLLDELSQCSEELNRLDSVLNEKCGRSADGRPHAPPTSAIRNAIADCREVVQQIGREKLATRVAEQSPQDSATDNSFQGGSPSTHVQAAPARLQDRKEAFQSLLRVAQFFKETEPHSPVSYALEQAVRWGKMPLPMLLEELIGDQNQLNAVYQRIGIKPGEKGNLATTSSPAATRDLPFAQPAAADPPKRVPGTPRT